MRYISFLLIAVLAVTTISCNKTALDATSNQVIPAPEKVVKEPISEEAEKAQKTLSAEEQALIEWKKAKEAAFSEYQLGLKAHNAGDFAAAIGHFSASISEDSTYAEAWDFRGKSKYKSGDKDGACSDWKKAASLGYSSSSDYVEKYCK